MREKLKMLRSVKVVRHRMHCVKHYLLFCRTSVVLLANNLQSMMFIYIALKKLAVLG